VESTGALTQKSGEDEVKAMAYRILIVENDADTAEMLDFQLRLSGHHADIATNGREALQLLTGNTYDAILSDLHMPVMAGEEFYRKVEQAWPHLAPRVVFVTAVRPQTPFHATGGERTVPVLLKPYTTQQLLQLIEDVVARDV
jgi:CheY-like chemotaxis protein